MSKWTEAATHCIDLLQSRSKQPWSSCHQHVISTHHNIAAKLLPSLKQQVYGIEEDFFYGCQGNSYENI